MNTAFEEEFQELTRRKVLRGTESEFSKDKGSRSCVYFPRHRIQGREPVFRDTLK
jgi:hypothetical protein